MRLIALLLVPVVMAAIGSDALAQRRDPDAFSRHVRIEADSLTQRMDRFTARHGKGAFRLHAAPEALIGNSAFYPGLHRGISRRL